MGAVAKKAVASLFRAIRVVSVLWMLTSGLPGSLSAAAAESAEPAFFPFQPPLGVSSTGGVEPIAHRGAAGRAPKNTRAALERCIDDGCSWVEVDVRRTRDGRHVLWHDATFEKLGDSVRRVKDSSLEELRTLDVGGWFAPRFREETLLTLEEALQRARGRIHLLLDCKEVDPAGVVREILAAGMERQVLIHDEPARLSVWRSAGAGRIAVMSKWRPAGGLRALPGAERPDAVEIDAPDISPEAVAFWHRQGVRVEAKCLGDWDTKRVWQAVAAAGVDWIQTDVPEEILAWRLRLAGAEKTLKVSYHRGANRYAPENTLEALTKAGRLGADFVEFDIRTTRDGEWFVLHDGRLDRTTDGQGPISEKTGAEVRALSAGRWFGRPFSEARVPSMDELLAAFPPGMELYFDAKDITPEALASALGRHGLVERTVVYQSEEYLLRLKSVNPRIRALPPLRDPKDLDRLAGGLKPYAVDANWRVLTKELMERCHALGIRVFSDEPEPNMAEARYREVIAWGIDVIQTDDPLRVYRAMRRRE
jgi:glycerophosphoryl diester phosphodiesterase